MSPFYTTVPLRSPFSACFVISLGHLVRKQVNRAATVQLHHIKKPGLCWKLLSRFVSLERANIAGQPFSGLLLCDTASHSRLLQAISRMSSAHSLYSVLSFSCQIPPEKYLRGEKFPLFYFTGKFILCPRHICRVAKKVEFSCLIGVCRDTPRT